MGEKSGQSELADGTGRFEQVALWIGSRVHFGLGAREHAERIEVRRIGGQREEFFDFKADQLVTLIEGSGRPVVSRNSELSDPRE